MADLKMTTKYDFGRLTKESNKRLTYTSWNDGDFKFDIRDWYEKGGVGKGISLTKTELQTFYDILKDMYESPEVDDELPNFDTDDELPDLSTEEVEEEAVEEETVEETTEKYPAKIQKIFDILDETFDEYETEKAYGVMPFAKGCGERLQYSVKQYEKGVGAVEKALTKLGLNYFVTDKGNLYIYTL